MTDKERAQLVPLTDYNPELEMVSSEYGEVTFAEWCHLEVGRLHNHGIRALVDHTGHGTCALFRQASGVAPVASAATNDQRPTTNDRPLSEVCHG